MSGGANIVEQYAGADVPARIELLIKYYPNFIRLVEGYEQSLEVIFMARRKDSPQKAAMRDDFRRMSSFILKKKEFTFSLLNHIIKA